MSIVINNFHNGQSSSPYVVGGAFSKSQNIDVFTQKGMARINYLPTGYSTNLTGLPIDFATNSNSSIIIYFADESEDVYSITTTSGAISKIGDNKGNNVEYFDGNLYATKGNTINKYNFTSWSDTGLTFTSLGVKDNHFKFVSKNDGKLYICGSYGVSNKFGIASLETDDTWTQEAFTMPIDYKPISLTELGGYIIIAAKKHEETTEINIPETSYFFWDRTKSTADKIISVPEANMTNFIRRGDIIYVAGGERGNVYSLTESGFQFYAQIPFDYDNKKLKVGTTSTTIGTNSFMSGAWWNDRLMIGTSSEDTLSPAGLYGIQDKKVVHEFNPSNGDDASVNDIFIGGMTVFSDGNLYFGWKKVAGETTTYGLDQVDLSNNRVTSYGSYIESLFYPVGTKFDLKNYSRVEVQLSRPFQVGEGIRLKFRKNINDSWTTLGTKDYSTDGEQTSLTFAQLNGLQNIQVRIDLTTGSTSNTPYVISVNLID